MESNWKGVSLIHRLRKRLSLQRRGFDCSTVRGITKWGGETKPTIPQREIAPDARRAIIVSEINLAKDLHETELMKILCEGKAESKFSPLYCPIKGWKNYCISTCSIQFLIQRRILWVSSYRATLEICSQAKKWLWILPPMKVAGSRKASVETSARAWPLTGLRTALMNSWDMQVIRCYPLSHLDRWIIRLYPTYQRLNCTFWVKIWSDLTLW